MESSDTMPTSCCRYAEMETPNESTEDMWILRMNLEIARLHPRLVYTWYSKGYNSQMD